MEQGEKRYLWGFGLRDGIILALLAAATAVAKMILRIPLHIPGHFSIVWMFFLVLGCALVPKRGAGLTLGILTGILATLFGFGHEGILVFFKWLSVGVVLEAFMLPMPDFARHRYLALVAGGTASGIKAVFSMLIFSLFGISDKAVGTFGAIAVASNVAFGALGGVIGWALWKRINK